MQLQAGTIDRRGVHGIEIDAVDAAYVDCRHLRAVGHLAEGKRLDAALLAELMVNQMFIEEIFAIRIHTGRLREFTARCKCENQSTFFANRTIARNCFGQINIYGKS
ncbi:hypothetical protein [Pandoraea sp. PE-S2R-1]|uniref:hypothetical protein n=1 Tax=Pandoraea sp. PE-S2R-1 TaxID=1986994 RepID=UPI00352B14EC